MAKKRKVALEDLRVGEEVEIIIRVQVQQVDTEDNSIYIPSASGHPQWFYTDGFENVTLKVKRKLIEDDVRAVSFEDWNDDFIFAVKADDGSWIDTEEKKYATTEDLIYEIKRGNIDTLNTYDVRSK